MSTEAPQITVFENTHVERCEKLLNGEMQIGGIVEALRNAVDGKDRAGQTDIVTNIAKRERLVFKAGAAGAIDRHLKATADGTKASALKVNKALLNFVSLVTPNIRLRARGIWKIDRSCHQMRLLNQRAWGAAGSHSASDI